jgi:hypothetical protein
MGLIGFPRRPRGVFLLFGAVLFGGRFLRYRPLGSVGGWGSHTDRVDASNELCRGAELNLIVFIFWVAEMPKRGEPFYPFHSVSNFTKQSARAMADMRML